MENEAGSREPDWCSSVSVRGPREQVQSKLQGFEIESGTEQNSRLDQTKEI